MNKIRKKLNQDTTYIIEWGYNILYTYARTTYYEQRKYKKSIYVFKISAYLSIIHFQVKSKIKYIKKMFEYVNFDSS